MTEADREKAEHQLRQLLERALLSVPYVRLDSVDEVTALFQSAVTLLEENLDHDSDDDVPVRGSTAPVASSRSKKVEGSQSDGAGLAASHSLESSPHQSPSTSQHNSVARPLPNKALIGTRETKDYSSPRGNVRSLGSNSARPETAGNSIGLKAKATSSRAKSAVGPSLGLTRGVGPKPSSRVPAGVARSEDDADADEEDESSEEIDQGPTPPPNATALPVPNPSMIKNKLLGSAVAEFGSREYPSPKLGGRSLGAATPDKSIAHEKKPVAATTTTTAVAAAAHHEESKQAVDPAIYQSPAQKVRETLEKTGEVIANKQLDKFRESTPAVEASPKQKQTSLLLMNLAKKEGDDNVSTPKAAYLRRLDSPDSHHGKLLQAKQHLQQLINKALDQLHNVSLHAPHHQIHDAFEKAVKKLEASLVNPTPEFRG